VPEATLDQLDLSRKLLESGSSPDVLGVDLIWTGVLERDLLDIEPHLTELTSSIDPKLLNAYTVNEKLVAIPFSVSLGVLKYRVDLLREYGYHYPPTTWDELETMAARIQAGERAKGKKNFWGYVWQGAAAESLTCNALEWQIAAGGGRIIESDRTISVNNAGTIRAWERGKRWIGWISPPSVLSYRERDSDNSFDSGMAAFSRTWGSSGVGQISLIIPPMPGNVAYSKIPGGPGGRASALGGEGLAISRRSTHPKEAIELVRFLVRDELTSLRNEQVTETWNWSDLVVRPSSLVGNRYDEVANAYIEAVHSVLAGQVEAKEAARKLEERLVKITGYRTGSPKQ